MEKTITKTYEELVNLVGLNNAASIFIGDACMTRCIYQDKAYYVVHISGATYSVSVEN